ncbi:type VII secretion protein EccCa [Mycobacterium marinum]|uniref:type VII secretion protein EccCa n=1 Tax=Mycobacterium marinum TaxID=1781 RepID=UPI00356A6597
MTEDLVVAAPPELAQTTSTGPLLRLVPLAMSIATLIAMAATYVSGAPSARNPTMLILPATMSLSLMVMAVSARGRRRGAGLDQDRVGYLQYLSELRQRVTEIAAAQRISSNRTHPEPDTVWTLIGGSRMWERRPADADFCRIRIGLGTQPLATRLVAAPLPPPHRSDPVTVNALRRFLEAHARVTDVPIAIALHGAGVVTIGGDPARVRALLRAMVCQLAVLHGPDQLLVAAVVSDRNRPGWEWLKWLPHNQHPSHHDEVGAERMVYPNITQASAAFDAVALPVMVIVDTDEHGKQLPAGVTVLEVGRGPDGTQVVVKRAGETTTLTRPDELDQASALVCARLLAPHRCGDRAGGHPGDWARMLGIGEIATYHPVSHWHKRNQRERLCVPIGATADGSPVLLDIKEPAARGMGPHGLCIGATGSGKSELLRTVALGMMVRNSPEVLNLLLIDFKGGATFLDLEKAPHVAAVITNLADQAPLVARMGEALAGEMNRRQHLLRTAGNFVSVAAYEDARRRGAGLAALPTLFIIVDEFAELLSQHPDFAEVFVAIGRLGRSLGMHLLLASQRLEEGRLRGLEAHLSYRVCLKTLSAIESRTALGTLDAFELPNTPGSGLLSSPTAELTRFETAFVSGPVPAGPPDADSVALPAAVRPFTSEATGDVRTGGADGADTATGPTVLQTVLDRIAGHGPRAHQVWLPPLDRAPALASLLSDGAAEHAELAVPIGVVDRPFDQSRTPLTIDLTAAAGNVAVVGAPQSGKSTTLSTLITALAATHDPDLVQFYCLDFGGGALAAVRDLPHVGAVAGRGEPDLIRGIVAELESCLRTRESLFGEQGIDSIAAYRRLRADSGAQRLADLFVVIDGWATLCHEFEELQEPITALAGQGLSYGLHVVVSATRWAHLRGSLKDQLGTRIELRLGDPADSEVDRRGARQVPRDRPGRGLCDDGMHMMIALPNVAEVVVSQQHAGSGAPAVPLLPQRVEHRDVVEAAGAALSGRILLGLQQRRLQPVAVDFEHHAHLLILGDNACGKSSALRTLCREITRTKTAAQARLFLVDFRRELLGLSESEYLGGHAIAAGGLGAFLPGLVELLRARMPAPDLSQARLRDRSWWSGPEIYLMVDDYDLVCTSAGNPLLALLEYLPYATDLGLHLIVARRSGGATRALFEPLLAALRDFGCMALMMSGRCDEGPLFGSGRPMPLPPGRAVLVTRAGDERLVQVAWTEPG